MLGGVGFTMVNRKALGEAIALDIGPYEIGERCVADFGPSFNYNIILPIGPQVSDIANQWNGLREGQKH